MFDPILRQDGDSIAIANTPCILQSNPPVEQMRYLPRIRDMVGIIENE